MRDLIEYEVPGGLLGRVFAGRLIDKGVDRMFEYRHEVTVADLAAHAKHAGQPAMQIAISGSSGLVGSSLVPMLTAGGHDVTRIVRGQASENEVAWDPTAESFDASPLAGADAVVHLAGESIAASRWNVKVKRRIRDSRVHGTRVLCQGLAKLQDKPRTLVTASAIGFYGSRRDEMLTEDSPPGDGYLAEVARGWEDAALPARDAGMRVVPLRFGMILSPRDGALAKMLTPFKCGVGGPIGGGRQWWSWIAIDDVVGAIHHALTSESLDGPTNAVSPHPVTNREFTKTLGRVLRRPAVLPMPGFAARLALGEMADELLLASARVKPEKLLADGYEFRRPALETALRHLLGK